MEKQPLTSLQLGLVILGLLAWVIAGLLYVSSKDFERASEPPHAVGVAPNTKAGLGTLGFAVAGGLCFLGAAVAVPKDRGVSTRPD